MIDGIPFADQFRQFVEWLLEATGSALAAELLARWESSLPFFWKVMAKDSGRGQDARPVADASTTVVASRALDRAAGSVA